MRKGTIPVLLALLPFVIYNCARPRGESFDGGFPPDIDSGFFCSYKKKYNCEVRNGEEFFQWCEEEYEFVTIKEKSCSREGKTCFAYPPLISCEKQGYEESLPVIGCALCTPCTINCVHNNVVRCKRDGSGWEIVKFCDTGRGEICFQGDCRNGCEYSEQYRSNVGCEYWAVDLDNAVVSSGNAAAQQFAVVVSNPTPVEATVTVSICNNQPCEENNIEVIEQKVVNPEDLELFLLPPREVDGSSEFGPGNDGTHTALGPRAYKITSTVPIVVYQFNPLENVQVFSNDATLLIPYSGLDTQYTVLGWPQTIAYTPYNPDTNMGTDLRAFLTIVATRPNTLVKVIPTTTVIGGGGIPQIHPYESFEIVMNQFDVLNLETGSFMADFTGSIVIASKPVAVFSGSEASDVPTFDTLAQRYCCADHLEHQLPPDTSWGTTFVVPHTPRRTEALLRAGAPVTLLPQEPEWYRIIARVDNTEVKTSLPPPQDRFSLNRAEFITIKSYTPFTVEANNPIEVGIFVGSQDTTGIDSNYPGGDPTFIIVPPVDQWRRDYLFLTPDKYAFDYVIVMVSKKGADKVLFDGEFLAVNPNCNYDLVSFPDTNIEYYIFTCQLSFPQIIPGVPRPYNLVEGVQNDGVHYVEVFGNFPENIGLIVYGFDAYVSYGYAGGMDLQVIK